MILHESVTHGAAIKGFERFKTYCLYDAWLEREIEYDYSKVVYEGDKIKGIIICTKHGPFWQSPTDHKRGHGCRECGNEARGKAQSQTTDQFIALAKEVHGDKYDYSRADERDGEGRRCIICREHGPFWQIPNNHLYDKGCRDCGNEAQAKAQSQTTDQFIALAKEVHGDKYDYSRADERDGEGTTAKRCIICREHGPFWQRPNDHLQGKGCSECANEAKAKAQSQTTGQFIALAKEVHGDKYDYSRANERDEEDRRCIICREHGPFWQIPNNHLHGKGCPKCGKYGFQPQLPAQLYLYNIEDRWLGFGITGDAKTRHTTHSRTLKDVEHELIHTFEFEEGANALEIETLLKQKFVMVDIGYDGFRTEATSISYLDSVLNIIEEHEEL